VVGAGGKNPCKKRSIIRLGNERGGLEVTYGEGGITLPIHVGTRFSPRGIHGALNHGKLRREVGEYEKGGVTVGGNTPPSAFKIISKKRSKGPKSHMETKIIVRTEEQKAEEKGGKEKQEGDRGREWVSKSNSLGE